MAPILIDSRDLKKIGFISALTAIFVFSAGFLFGHEQAASFYQAGSAVEPLTLPEKITSIESDIEPQAPATVDVGEEIDVDQPEPESKDIAHTVAANKIISEVNNTDNHILAVSVDNEFNDKLLAATQSTDTKSKNIQTENVETDDNVVAKVTIPKTTKNKSAVNADIDMDKNYQAVVVTSFTPDELNKIKYSIQVGMYGQLINAENMMNMLQAKKFDAYVSDYTNKKNEVRYNVRFGYFVDKKAALSALQKYKNDQHGDGYLVKFSVESITDIARATNLDQPVIDEESSNNLRPEVKPSDAVQEKISPVDAVSTTNVLTDTHAEIMANTQIETLTN